MIEQPETCQKFQVFLNKRGTGENLEFYKETYNFIRSEYPTEQELRAVAKQLVTSYFKQKPTSAIQSPRGDLIVKSSSSSSVHASPRARREKPAELRASTCALVPTLYSSPYVPPAGKYPMAVTAADMIHVGAINSMIYDGAGGAEVKEVFRSLLHYRIAKLRKLFKTFTGEKKVFNLRFFLSLI